MIYHKYPECEIWVDSLFMLPPCLAAAGEYKEAVRQYFGISSLLQDPDSGLLRHIWNDSEKRYPDPMLWSVGNGWAVCGAAHLIELLPDTMPSEKEKLRQFSAALIDRILACLGPDALLHNDLQDPSSFTEVNGAQMTAAAIYSGLSGNWLPPACRVTADRIYAAVCRKVDRFGFLHDVCGAPCFVAPGIAPEGNAMFLIMDAEKEAYEREQS
jgi:rhamnogalacturonyl hydrolase YesR